MRVRTRLTAAAAGALMCLTVAACGSAEPAGAGACPNGKVRFGVEPYEDPAKLTPAYEVLAKALESKLGCPVELKVVDDYSAEVLAMRNGQLELAQFGPLGYVFASTKANAQAVASFADSTGKLTTYTGGIWVAADSPVKSINDLTGKTLALSSPGSTSGDALPRYALKKAGIADDAVKIDYAGGHPEALLALKNAKVDAAEINSQQLATATAAGTFDKSKFRQIWTSEPIPNDPITMRGDLDKAFQDKVREALLGLSPSDVAKVSAFLDVDPPGPLVAVTKETYQPLFDLASALGLSEDDV
ncbi:phosphonate transport system substrate-binding protein [Actinokineospora alba]|uniref:Phosphonate transport system substrate-binding protein n=1 Tax=Actinokineospora alba TaxID=504798 RepID=A0A1H0ENX3_9PSEU|nr:phosphate/phosphite/phosphonate ABC transporter substrate-binding protein [Actinokineospora alba]TDP69157.1 phosphonate transport system substrate-binding protein [Actinokineospora alba]SDI23105.1 phosphonate transport system substrate-binding protein [Actinokineospora alba]SDN84019.1 phosphonate transport system substrate-binding protein [Actinokineospora alba]